MKPATLAVAALALLGALVLCAQRWGYEAGRMDCGVQLAGTRAALERQTQALAALRKEGVQRAARSTRALLAAQASQAGAQAEAARILALRADGGACLAAEKLIASEMR